MLLYNYKYPQNTQLQDANNNSPYFNSGDRIRLFGGAIRFDTYNIELEPDNANNHFNDQMYTRMIIDGSGNVGIGSKFQSMNNPSVILEIDSTDAIRLPVGDTNDRPAVTNNGYIRFNSDSSKFEGYNGTTLGWETLNGVTNNSRTAYITAEENTDQIDFYAPMIMIK